MLINTQLYDMAKVREQEFVVATQVLRDGPAGGSRLGAVLTRSLGRLFRSRPAD